MTPIKHEERVELRVPTEDLERWRATADAERMTLSAWIRYVCNHQAIDQVTIDRVAARAKKGKR